jgi:hypothetical protein
MELKDVEFTRFFYKFQAIYFPELEQITGSIIKKNMNKKSAKWPCHQLYEKLIDMNYLESISSMF